ncbi:MAG: NADH-quinone oxidoreductase subunit L [Candidatus Thermoplasmatota archaeon]|nr:NADH-quinone oxidoreductase subunit L [Candidatus Thermoplasmatota archaeon]
MYWPGWFIFISPLIGFVLSYGIGRKRRNLAGIIASLSILGSLIASLVTFLQVQSSGAIYNHFQWFYNINAGIYIDHLSLVMAIMVSFVSLMIHLFAMYYMKDDPNRHIYFAETALFTAGMLGLVVASNLVLFFLFWELVGLCSYLLIGFWFFKPNAASAAKKAFIVTRVGDLLFLVGMALLYESLTGFTGLGSNSPLSIPFLITNASAISAYVGKATLGIVAVLFLAGAAGKSSQFPLHVWIPDAMEGPTTVSALIHAATMVTAGVYLVARVFNLFYFSADFALYSVVILGSFTAIFAGIVGLFVNDIKRILAYSTISQIGYMLSAIGLGGLFGYTGVSYGMFHLVVHAVFKALLFMSAGAILIALMDLRDTRLMGGLWKKMPLTITLLFIGSLALVAFPLTSGYFSKDTIIDASWVYYAHYGTVESFLPWLFLSLGALMTTLYTFRMFFRVALGKPRSHLAEHSKDPSIFALIPLFVLAFGSLTLGLIQTPFYNYIYSGSSLPTAVPFNIRMVPLAFLAIGIVVTYAIYGTDLWKKLDFSRNPLYKLGKNKFYLDYLFTNILAERAIVPLAAGFTLFENRYNRSVEKTGSEALKLGDIFRKIQNGVIENYFIILIMGISLIFIIIELVGVF